MKVPDLYSAPGHPVTRPFLYTTITRERADLLVAKVCKPARAIGSRIQI